MGKGRQHNSSALFLVRLWVDEADHDKAEWRGRLVHVLSGQAYDFRDWRILEALMLELTPIPETTPAQPSDAVSGSRG